MFAAVSYYCLYVYQSCLAVLACCTTCQHAATNCRCHPTAALPQSGMDEQDISAALAQLSATVLPCAESFAAPARPEPLPRHALRLHAPPRASAKLTHTIRHVAAKAVAQLGLASAGLVRVSGWLAPSPEWEQRYLLPDEALHHMPDYDAGVFAGVFCLCVCVCVCV
jgi:hypothetical protein